MAYSFNGSGQYLSTTYPLSGTDPATVAFFVQSDAVAGYCVWHSGVTSDISRLNIFAVISPINTLAVGAASTDLVSSSISTTTYAANTWFHGAGVYASAASRSSYLDGGGKATDTTTISNITLPTVMQIGGRINVNVNNSFLSGRMAECAIWSVALTDAEIASLAKGFKPTRIRPQSLVFYAPLLRNLQDIKGGLALTNNNGATVADHPRVY